MNTMLEVFDPAMCCSTGVCGPSVDPKLARFAADLDWLKSQGVTVRRYNLGQAPGVFAGREAVRATLERDGETALPLIFVNEREVSRSAYPAREMLAQWAGASAARIAETLYTPAVAELVAIGAAIAADCEPCFKYHYGQAPKLGMSDEDMLAAVRTAQAVKETPARNMIALAERFLGAPGKPALKPAAIVAARAPKVPGAKAPDQSAAEVNVMHSLDRPARYYFFTGKGGAGKTTTACAAALVPWQAEPPIGIQRLQSLLRAA